MASLRLDSRTVVALVVAATVIVLACAEGGYAPYAVGAGTVLVAIAIVAGTLTGALSHDPPPGSLVAAAACLAGLLAFTGLSLGWSGAIDAGFVDVVRLAGYLGVLLLAGLAGGPGRGIPLLVGVAVAGVAVAMVALGSRLLGLGGGDFEIVSQLPPASGRLSFPVGYWNALGALMALAAPALAWIAVEGRSTRIRAGAIAAFVPLLLVVQMTSSRGALIALLVGLAVAIACAADGRRTAAALLVAIAGSAPTIVIALALAPEVLEGPGDGAPGSSELLVAAGLLASAALLAAMGDRAAARIARARPVGRFRVRGRHLLAAAVVVAVAIVAIAGPSALIGDFRSTPADTEIRTERAAGIFSTSGSGRAQFWETALGAFAEEPVRGIGAGSFEYYWNQNGSLLTPARNAHSEPLEALAELGLIGFGCFTGFLVVVALTGVRRARGPGGPVAGAMLGVFAAGMVGVSIDWTWQVPAVAVPILIAAGGLTGTAFAAAPARPAPGGLRCPAMTLALLALAVPALWAGGVLALASAQLSRSTEALARGQVAEAATAARTAAAIEPWAAEPWLRLAQVELAAGNDRAALRDVTVAIRRSPEDPRSWVLATVLAGELGNGSVSVAYGLRTAELVPD